MNSDQEIKKTLDAMYDHAHKEATELCAKLFADEMIFGFHCVTIKKDGSIKRIDPIKVLNNE